MKAIIKIHRMVMEEILNHTSLYPELECGGYLIGYKEIYSDKIIIYIDTIYHDLSVGDSKSYAFNEYSLLKANLFCNALDIPKEVVGNYHSHGNFEAIFSSVDKKMQKSWNNNCATLIYSPKYNTLVGQVVCCDKVYDAKIDLYGSKDKNGSYIEILNDSKKKVRKKV